MLSSYETHRTQTTQISGTVSYESRPIACRLIGWQEGGNIIKTHRYTYSYKTLSDTPICPRKALLNSFRCDTTRLLIIEHLSAYDNNSKKQQINIINKTTICFIEQHLTSSHWECEVKTDRNKELKINT